MTPNQKPSTLDAAKFDKVPMEELTTPRSGRCIANHWWNVTDDDCALYFRKIAPQCNRDRRIVERIAKSYPFNTRPVLVPVAFVRNRE